MWNRKSTWDPLHNEDNKGDSEFKWIDLNWLNWLNLSILKNRKEKGLKKIYKQTKSHRDFLTFKTCNLRLEENKIMEQEKILKK